MKTMRKLAVLGLGLATLTPLVALGQDTPAGPGERRAGRQRSAAWWAPLADRGWLGVRLSVKPEAVAAFQSETLAEDWIAVPNLAWIAEKWDGIGALVLATLAETPAEKAGLLAGDVILSFNGIRTRSPGELAFVAQRAVAGHDAELEVLRDGETRIVLVEVGMHPADARRLKEEREAARGESKENAAQP